MVLIKHPLPWSCFRSQSTVAWCLRIASYTLQTSRFLVVKISFWLSVANEIYPKLRIMLHRIIRKWWCHNCFLLISLAMCVDLAEACQKRWDPRQAYLHSASLQNQWQARDALHHRPLYKLCCCYENPHWQAREALGGAGSGTALSAGQLIKHYKLFVCTYVAIMF